MDAHSILIVDDDDPLARSAIRALLEREHLRLFFGENGQDALRLAEENLPDLILLDVVMPGLDGFETCRRLRANPALAEIPIVMITSLDDRDSRLRGLEAGVDDFLTRPVDQLELLARVQSILRLNRYRKLMEAGGISGMRERVNWLGGEFEIASSPGAGTTIRAVFRLQEGI